MEGSCCCWFESDRRWRCPCRPVRFQLLWVSTGGSNAANHRTVFPTTGFGELETTSIAAASRVKLPLLTGPVEYAGPFEAWVQEMRVTKIPASALRRGRGVIVHIKMLNAGLQSQKILNSVLAEDRFRFLSLYPTSIQSTAYLANSELQIPSMNNKGRRNIYHFSNLSYDRGRLRTSKVVNGIHAPPPYAGTSHK